MNAKLIEALERSIAALSEVRDAVRSAQEDWTQTHSCLILTHQGDDNKAVMILAFAITEKVRIKELNRPGIVIAVYYDRSAITYKVRYFDDAAAEEVYFYAEELESITESNPAKEDDDED